MYHFTPLYLSCWLTAVVISEVSLSLSLCISHITDATSIMRSVGCFLFLHLSSFSCSWLSPSLSLGLSGHRELWSAGIVSGRGREINTTSRRIGCQICLIININPFFSSVCACMCTFCKSTFIPRDPVYDMIQKTHWTFEVHSKLTCNITIWFILTSQQHTVTQKLSQRLIMPYWITKDYILEIIKVILYFH